MFTLDGNEINKKLLKRKNLLLTQMKVIFNEDDGFIGTKKKMINLSII